MFETSCHCGAVRLSLPHTPERVTSCNCSLCFRLGGLWAYYRRDELRFLAGEGTTAPYIQGDRMLETHHCPICGCVTHWIACDPSPEMKCGVNARLGERTVVEGLAVRRLNGAGDWSHVDEPARKRS